jgi:2-methylisocitrate lyase-like PEP mutase family enzyme
MPTQLEKIATLRALHAAPGAFVIANAWDGASTHILEGLGFPAIATSSGAHAGTLGRRDGHVTREEALDHARLIVENTALPVSADRELLFDSAAEAAETIRAGGRDRPGGRLHRGCLARPLAGIYGFDHAVERVAAAVEAARATGTGFVVTGRTQNHLTPGADPPRPSGACRRSRRRARHPHGARAAHAGGREGGLFEPEAVQLHGRHPRPPFSVAELEAAGVKRISLATSFSRRP